MGSGSGRLFDGLGDIRYHNGKTDVALKFTISLAAAVAVRYRVKESITPRNPALCGCRGGASSPSRCFTGRPDTVATDIPTPARIERNGRADGAIRGRYCETLLPHTPRTLQPHTAFRGRPKS